MSEEMMRGRMNILRSRIRISPGKDTSRIVPSEKFASRPRNPRKQPIKTPAMVRTKSMFSPVHFDICKHKKYVLNVDWKYRIILTVTYWYWSCCNDDNYVEKRHSWTSFDLSNKKLCFKSCLNVVEQCSNTIFHHLKGTCKWIVNNSLIIWVYCIFVLNVMATICVACGW